MIKNIQTSVDSQGLSKKNGNKSVRRYFWSIL